jgi:metal-responsive CopG/Arc/MetJ family transcriptional regulator
MKQPSIRTTVDIPAPLYRKLKARAAEKGRSVRSLVLDGVRTVLQERRRTNHRKVGLPLIASDSPKVDLTNDQIYEHIEFP